MPCGRDNKWDRSALAVNPDLIVFVSGRGETVDMWTHSCLAERRAVPAMWMVISVTSG